jgi:antitoxin ParD1/3/4
VKQQNSPLTDKHDEIVERVVQTGEHQDANEAIRDAQRVLQQRRQENALKLKRLRLKIQAGIDDLESGDFVEIGDADLDAHIEGLGEVEGSGSS